MRHPAMFREDRVAAIFQRLTFGVVTTAPEIAKRADMSTRTVYRHIARLKKEGWPIQGEAGVGYRLNKPKRDAK